MKNKFYSILVVLLPMLISFSVIKQATFSQAPKNKSINLVKRWHVDSPAFINLDADKYELNSEYIGFGNFIEFKEDNTFNSYYHAFCGNDCFTTTNGTYLLKDNMVEIFIISATQTGFCLNPISFNNKKIGNFKIIQKTKEQLLLKRIQN